MDWASVFLVSFNIFAQSINKNKDKKKWRRRPSLTHAHTWFTDPCVRAKTGKGNRLRLRQRFPFFSLIQCERLTTSSVSMTCQLPQHYAATHIKWNEEDCVASECWELSESSCRGTHHWPALCFFVLFWPVSATRLIKTQRNGHSNVWTQ